MTIPRSASARPDSANFTHVDVSKDDNGEALGEALRRHTKLPPKNPSSPKPSYRLDESLLVNIPEMIQDRDQWVLWRYVKKGDGWTKLLYQPRKPSEPASSTDPQTWDPFVFTVDVYRDLLGTRNRADGIGFCFSYDGGLVGFDLDNILRNGRIDLFGESLLKLLTPTYHEISPSGCGFKGIVQASLLESGFNRKNLGPNGDVGFEMYGWGRFFTITGEIAGDCRDIRKHQAAVDELYAQYKPKPHEGNGHATCGPPLAEDAVLIDRARNAKNGDRFARLFDRGEFDRGSHSEADFSLCCDLAFWGNRNAEFIDRVFRHSKLFRDKWDSPRGDTTYGAITIQSAIDATENVYKPRVDDPRAVIDLTADFHLAVDASVAVLTTHEEVFRRVNSLARIVRHEPGDGAKKGIRRAAGAPLIAPLGIATARTLVSRVARFRRFDKREQEWEFKAPPKDILESVLAEQNYPRARELMGVIEAPTLRPDGSLLCNPGYDVQTGLLYIPNEHYPIIRERPSKANVEAARDALLYLVDDFPFKGDSDKAAWLASVLTLIARSAIDGPVPAFLISSNQAGSGKTWLAILAALIASGRVPAMDGYATEPTEMEKVLTSLAIAGDRCIVFDNAANGSAIGSSALDRAIMARGSFRGRILGKNEQSPDVPWSATVFVTGNNICTRDDSLRRFVPCFLEYKKLKPETRDPKQFKVYQEHKLHLQEYVLKHRARLVAAALTILRGYLVAGAKPADLEPMDFPEWDQLIRQAVHFAMEKDPVGSRGELAADDQTMGERVRLVNAWKQLCDAAKAPLGLTTEEAATFLAKNESDIQHKPLIITFAVWAKRGAKTPDSRSLGYVLRSQKNAPTSSGMRIKSEERSKTLYWFVESPEGG